ncbi:MAG: Kazal-type serine protease inhibitor family protein [Candidatus Gracilibacteria bacterium]|nr:Kazal-type serine protease inhibitor family protein [Candidatus Gracilibacteria bacterium]
MKYIIKILSVTLSVLLLVSIAYATGTSSSSGGYNTPIYGSIDFDAYYENGDVFISWTKFEKNEGFKYYKVVRSQTNDNPVYPDDGYIKVESDINKLDFVDYSPKVGTSYYRVCAITSENNRYCSNVVKIYVEKSEQQVTVCTMEYAPMCGEKDGAKKTYSNKCMLNAAGAKYLYSGECGESTTINNTYTNTYNLSYTLRVKADKVILNFILKIEQKYTTTEKRIVVIEDVISKLKAVGEKNPKLQALVNYFVDKLQVKLDNYDNGLSELEEIFNNY